jgi:dipeptidyl aminopeptidase/acylaminoacyl peptidase
MTFGELDLQVSVAQNKTIMEEALKRGGNKNYKSIVFPKANHLYQTAKTGSPGEYAELPKEFVPGFLETISNWILETTK